MAPLRNHQRNRRRAQQHHCTIRCHDRRRFAFGMGVADRHRTGRDAGRAIAHAQHGVRLSRSQLPDDCRAAHRPLAVGSTQGSARARLARTREAGGPGDRRHRASAGVPEQRPSRRHARRGSIHVRESLWRPAGIARRGVREQRRCVSGCARSRRGGHRGGGGRGSSRKSGRRVPNEGAQGGSRRDRKCGRCRHLGREARARGEGDGARCDGATRHWSGEGHLLRSRRRIRRLESGRAPARAIGGQAAFRRSESLLRAGCFGASGALGRCVQRQLRSPRLHTGRSGGRGRGSA